MFSLELHEKDRIVAALDAASGSKVRAAKLLGISRSTLFRKIKEYKL